jgi:hypothetical protein
MGAIIARSSPRCSPIPLSVSWTWIVRSCKQMSLNISKFVNVGGNNPLTLSNLIDNVRALRVILRLCGYSLLSEYQSQFEKLLKLIRDQLSIFKPSNSILSEEVLKIIQFVDFFTKNEYIPPVFYRKQEPFVMEVLIALRLFYYRYLFIFLINY